MIKDGCQARAGYAYNRLKNKASHEEFCSKARGSQWERGAYSKKPS